MPESATPRLDGDTILANARALGPAIEAAADDIARERRLPTELVEAVRRAGIFRIAFPRDWGGPEMDILQQCAVMEILAYHDGSTAWVAMICSSGPFERRRRDLTTISAHLVGQRRAFQTAGQLLFGDDVPTFV